LFFFLFFFSLLFSRHRSKLPQSLCELRSSVLDQFLPDLLSELQGTSVDFRLEQLEQFGFRRRHVAQRLDGGRAVADPEHLHVQFTLADDELAQFLELVMSTFLLDLGGSREQPAGWRDEGAGYPIPHSHTPENDAPLTHWERG
ncbi:hypothetical protein PFISCL1PPCAC_25224, partial [Pristionchus fissidentatus]